MDEFCERLFKIFTNKQDRLLEYDIDSLAGQDETQFLLCENNLLLNKMHVKRLYRHVHKIFLSKTKRDFDVDMYTLLIVIINPNFASAWSKRKLCVNEKRLSDCGETIIQDELYLNKLILNKHFKCEHAFMYRRWLVRNQREYKLGALATTQYEAYENDFFTDEFNFIKNLSNKQKSNYYCWSYINWLLKTKRSTTSDFILNLIESFNATVYLNVSDFCVFNFRLNLFQLHFTQRHQQNGDLVLAELKLIDDLLVRYARYQTIWYYRRYFLLLVKTNLKLVINSNSLHTVDECLYVNLKNYFGESLDNSLLQCELDGLRESFVSLFEYFYKRECLLSKKMMQLAPLRECNSDFLLNIEIYSRKHEEFLNKFY